MKNTVVTIDRGKESRRKKLRLGWNTVERRYGRGKESLAIAMSDPELFELLETKLPFGEKTKCEVSDE